MSAAGPRVGINPSDLRRVLVVDHTSLPGGAELALPRTARHTKSALRFLFLEPNFRDLGFPDSAEILGPDSAIGPSAQLGLLRKELHSGGYAAVMTNTLRAAVFVALVNPHVPHFLYLQDGADPGSLSWTKRMLLQHLVMPRVARVFPNSVWTGESLGDKHSVKVSRPVFSPSGGHGSNRRPLEESHSEPSTLRLLSLSRIVEWKGLHVVIEALSILGERHAADRITLTVAGGNLMGPDSYLQDLIATANALPFAVQFVGHQDDIATLLDNHDVLVHASIRPEPFGQVIVQGLSAHMAVIASNAGGPSEIIEDGKSGLLHTPGDARDLADQIDLLLSDPERRRALQRAGAIRATMFSDAAVVARFDEELRMALEAS
jgi:glycosyltransferase involved in cell wall biosynthesis